MNAAIVCYRAGKILVKHFPKHRQDVSKRSNKVISENVSEISTRYQDYLTEMFLRLFGIGQQRGQCRQYAYHSYIEVAYASLVRGSNCIPTFTVIIRKNSFPGRDVRFSNRASTYTDKFQACF